MATKRDGPRDLMAELKASLNTAASEHAPKAREYPTGALPALWRAWETSRTTMKPMLDALAAMPEADRAELARWLWPEGHDFAWLRCELATALANADPDHAAIRRLIERAAP
jgi:hypothetical protein